jgi:putative inorganic carbon (hco3(-)) transporter
VQVQPLSFRGSADSASANGFRHVSPQRQVETVNRRRFPVPRSAGNDVKGPRDDATVLKRPEAPQFSAWRDFKHQRVCFYALLAYLLFEYVRPQSIYPAIAVLPWSFLSVLLAYLAYFAKPEGTRLRSPGTTALILFTAILLLSSFAAYSPQRSYSSLYLFTNWVLVYFAMVLILNSPQRWLLALLAFLLFSFKMALHASRSWAGRGFTFDIDGVVGAPGWFYNSGELGIQMCILLPLSLAFILAYRHQWTRRVRFFMWLIPISSVMAILGSSSRGAVLGGAAALLAFLGHSKHKIRTLVVLGLLAAAAWWSMPPEFASRFDTAGADRTSTERLDRWRAGIDMIERHPVLGIGYDNWAIYYPPHYKPGATSGELCHNIFIQAGAELGFSGLLALVGVVLACFYMTMHARRQARGGQRPDLAIITIGLDGALLGFLVSGFFVTVLYYPYLWIHLGFCASLYGIVVKRAPVAGKRAPGRRALNRVAVPAIQQAAAQTGSAGVQL